MMIKTAAWIIVNFDETWCKVRRFNRYTKKYMWVLVNKAHGIVIIFYDEGSRGRKVLTDFLGEADLKALMSDGYNAYTFLDGELEKTDHLICMAHARVKYEKAYQYGEDPVAKEFADMISELYDLEDGSYPIDNNLAERSVRPFTTKRKCSHHFGSDEGVEMSAVYYSVIGTLKLCGKSVWNFFGEYFRCEVLGLDTYKDYLPALSR